MTDFVTCKFDEDQVKNEIATLRTTWHLPASFKMIRSKVKALSSNDKIAETT